MPEPNINLLNIHRDSFEVLFRTVIQDLVNDTNKTGNIYNFAIVRHIPNLILNYRQLSQYNCSCRNMYEYFWVLYDEFYDYEWILALMKYYESGPEEYNNRYDKLKYSMIQIIQLVIDEFSIYVFQYR